MRKNRGLGTYQPHVLAAILEASESETMIKVNELDPAALHVMKQMLRSYMKAPDERKRILLKGYMR